MRILLLGDCHFRTRRPRARTEEDWLGACMGKLGQVLDIAKERANLILQVGDFFDSPNVSDEAVIAVMGLLENESTNPRLYAIHGQHDLAYHTEAHQTKSKLAVLQAAGMIDLAQLGQENICEDFSFYGASFGQEPCALKDPDRFNVLVAHAMVGDRPLWPGHDLTGPEAYVNAHPGYDLYVLGDYHYPFSARVGCADVINPGCLLRMRNTERERGHKPKVVLYDTETREAEDIFLDVAPPEQAFREPDPRPERRAFDVSGLAEKLRGAGLSGMSFRENLAKHMERTKPPEAVRDAVWKAVGEANDGNA